MRSFEQITQLVSEMMTTQSPIIAKMRLVQQQYDGDYVLPVPSVDTEPTMPPLTPALISEAVDKSAQRAASVEPMLLCPAVDANRDRGVRSVEYASIRRRALRATYHHSKWQLGRRRSYRQLSAYFTTSVLVVPDFRMGLPRLEVRDPLSTFSEEVAENELRPPSFCAFVTRHSAAAIRKMHSRARAENGGPITDRDQSAMWDMFEWYDEDQIVFGILGPSYTATMSYDETRPPAQQISPTYPNRIGMVPVIAPANVTLSRVGARLANLLGNVNLQAKLLGLDILAQEKAIFPDVYAIGRQNATPAILGGAWQDGRSGNMNLLTDVEQVGVLRNTPDQRTGQIIDRLERNFRISSGLVSQYGGETSGSMRTGRGFDAMMGMSVDPGIQELHEIHQAWMPHMNACILAMYKEYWGGKTYSLHSGWAGDTSLVKFTPDDHFEILDSVVSYPIPGADVVQQTQILGSLLGTNTLSLRTFRNMHPWINDPENEGRLVDEEQFENALRQSILQQLASGQIPLPVATIIKKYVRKGFDIFEAVDKADQEIRARQAEAAPPPAEGQVAAPEQMPGMAGGPQQLQQQAPPEAQPQVEVPPDVERMKQLMSAMEAS